MKAVLFLALMAGAILATAVFPLFGYLNRAAVWGLVLLVSFAGWGSAVARFLAPGASPDLGLRLAWGMAALVSIGGIACLASLATRAVLLVLIVAGIVLEYRYRTRSAAAPATAARRPIGTLVALGAAALLVGIQYYAGAAGTGLTHDDFNAYLVFPQKILASGTLIEPFSLRRLAAYGGQSFLHALTLIGAANPLQVPLLDVGISLIVVLALVIGDRDRAPVGLWLLPVLLLVTLPTVRANSTSLMSGVVLFLALFRTANWPALEIGSRRAGIVLGMLAAAAAALRSSYIVPAAAFVVLLQAPGALRALRRPPAARRQQLAERVAAPLAMLVCLLPWAALSYRSSGTPLYPLALGNYQPQYGNLSSAGLAERLAFLWANLMHWHPVHSLPLFLLAALLIPWRQTRGALPALTAASLLGFIAVVWAFPTSDPWNVSRYCFGFVVATTLAVAMHAGSLRWTDWQRQPLRAAAPAVLVLAGVAFQVQGVAAPTYGHYSRLLSQVRVAASRPIGAFGRVQRYHDLQATVPAGAPLFVMLDQPFWLDFRRNPIDLIDLPGQVSPPPGMPLDDDEALVAYLGAQGFRHVAFVRPDASRYLYRRSMWTQMTGWAQMLGPDAKPMWRDAAPRYLKAFDRFESLMNSRRRLYDDGTIVVLDLDART